MRMKANDIFGLGKVLPLDKLIEIVSSVTGRISKPYFDRKDIDTRAYEIRKIAEARADEMKIISQAVKENFLLTGGIEYTENGVAISSPKELIGSSSAIDFLNPTLEERIKSRIDYIEEKKQLNLESITAFAADELKDEQPVTDEPIDENWKSRFFNIAEEVSNEDMQALWGRILAGEIKKPKSYSLRTLELLRNLSQDEAECFLKFGKLAISSDDKSFIINFQAENLLKEKYKLIYEDRLLMEELGIIASNDLEFYLHPTTTKMETVFTIGNIVVIVYRDKNLPKQTLPVLAFTKAGKELLQLIDFKPEIDYIQLLASKFRKKGIEIKYAVIRKIEEEMIYYDDLLDVPLTKDELLREQERLKSENFKKGKLDE